MTAGNLQHVARLIEIAVAPIFLLTAVSTTLMVLIHRLSRIVDRGRSLERAVPDEGRRGELALLESRARLIYLAMTLGVCAALMVCVLMTLAFLGEIVGFNAAKGVAFFFIGALICYTGALTSLLREVFLAVGSFRLRIHPVEK